MKKSVSLRTRLEEPAKHFLFCSAKVPNCKVQLCEAKTSAANGCIEREQAAVSQGALAKSGRSTDEAAKYKTAWATMQLHMEC